MTLTIASSAGLFVFGTWFITLWGLGRIEAAEAAVAYAHAELLAAERDIRLMHTQPRRRRVVANPAPGLTDDEVAEFLAVTDAMPIDIRGRPRYAAVPDTIREAA